MAQITYNDTPGYDPNAGGGYQNQPWYQTAQSQAATNASQPFLSTPSGFGGGRGSYLTPQTPAPGGAKPGVASPATNTAATAPAAPAPAFTYNTTPGYNSNQYLSTPSAQQLAGMYGGTVTQTSGLGGPNAPPPQNQISIPGMNDPSNAGILAQMTQQFGQPMTNAILNAQNNYNGLAQAQASVAAANSPQALAFWQNIAPTLAFQPNGGISYPGYPAGMTLASSLGTLTPQGWSNAPATAAAINNGLGYTPNTNVGGGVTPQNDTVQQLLPAINRYFNNALGQSAQPTSNSSLTALLSALFGVPLDNFLYNGQPRYSLFY